MGRMPDEAELKRGRRWAERELRKMLRRPVVQSSFSVRRSRRIAKRKWELAFWLLIARDALALKPKKRTDAAMQKIEDGWREAGPQKLWEAAMIELGP